MKRISTIFALTTISLSAAACGGGASTPAPATSPTTTAAVEKAPVTEPKATPTPAPVATPNEPTNPAPAPAEATAEKCDGPWVCVKVLFDTKKVEKRETKLIGDPAIESTWSKTSDGRPVTFDAFSKGAVEVTLRRKPGNKNEVVAKSPMGGEIVIDRHDGSVDDFSHVGLIATEQGGALLVDIRYMK